MATTGASCAEKEREQCITAFTGLLADNRQRNRQRDIRFLDRKHTRKQNSAFSQLFIAETVPNFRVATTAGEAVGGSSEPHPTTHATKPTEIKSRQCACRFCFLSLQWAYARVHVPPLGVGRMRIHSQQSAVETVVPHVDARLTLSRALTSRTRQPRAVSFRRSADGDSPVARGFGRGSLSSASGRSILTRGHMTAPSDWLTARSPCADERKIPATRRPDALPLLKQLQPPLVSQIRSVSGHRLSTVSLVTSCSKDAANLLARKAVDRRDYRSTQQAINLL